MAIGTAESNDLCVFVKVREVIRILERDGWTQVRQRGSHRQFRHPEKVGRVTVSGNLGDDVPLGTLRAMFRQARIEWRRP